ncbi:hypothetical protein FHT44_006191 [Mycolicibacterium sp. BK634]|nr:hypothetical protein [Mycolicibacterium sp. BK634]
MTRPTRRLRGDQSVGYRINSDHVSDPPQMPKLKLHPLLWTAGFALAFTAGAAAAVIALWPSATVWFGAAFIVIVIAAAQAARNTWSMRTHN